MMTLVVAITCFLFIAQVKDVSARSCAHHIKVSTPNCSFEASESCSETYRTTDKHGLKWGVYNGAIQTNIIHCLTQNGQQPCSQSYNNYNGYNLMSYNNGYNRVSTLVQASPFNRYAYIGGTNDSRRWGIWTDMTSPAFVVFGGCLQFIVHNSVCGTYNDIAGNTQGVTLKVKLKSSANSEEELLLREYACTNDSNWYPTNIPLRGITGTYRLIFIAPYHRWTNQFVAIDHIIYSEESCSLQDDDNFEAGDCDWEADDHCGYDTVPDAATEMTWTLQNKADILVRSTTFQGSVLKLSDGKADMTEIEEGSFANISLVSPQVEVREEGCLVLSYYSGRHSSDNDGLAALSVTWIKSTNETGLLYNFPAVLVNDWLSAFVPLPAGKYSLVFTAQLRLPYGELEHDMTAIDDIDIYKSSCDTIQCNPSVHRKCSNQYACSQQGTCIGSSLKHYSCQCTSPYIGKSCQSSYTYNQNEGFSNSPRSRYG